MPASSDQISAENLNLSCTIRANLLNMMTAALLH